MKKFDVSKTQIVFIGGGLLMIILVVIIILPYVWGRIEQPLAFNHRIHGENGMECLDCHPYYEENASSGRPSQEECSFCHQELLGESQAEKKLIEYIKSGKKIEWNRLYRVPEDVYFSHRRHVVLGDIQCSTCHGDIGESSKPPSKPLNITMEKCIKCHKKRGAEIDCISCHR